MATHSATTPLEQLLHDASDVLEGRTGACSLADIRSAALRRAGELERDAPRFRRAMNRELFALGVPVIALYRTLREDAGLQRTGTIAAGAQRCDFRYRARG